MSRPLRHALHTFAALAWAVLIWGATPHGDIYLPSGGARLAVVVAGVTTVTAVLLRLMRPGLESYAAGKMVGRIEALTEVDQEQAEVFRLADYRR